MKVLSSMVFNGINMVYYFEINEYLYNDIKGLLIFFGYVNIELKKDSFGKFRFVKAAKYAKID